jgi:hypothetical protein
MDSSAELPLELAFQKANTDTQIDKMTTEQLRELAHLLNAAYYSQRHFIIGLLKERIDYGI